MIELFLEIFSLEISTPKLKLSFHHRIKVCIIFKKSNISLSSAFSLYEKQEGIISKHLIAITECDVNHLSISSFRWSRKGIANDMR